MKPTKKLLAFFKELELPDYMIKQLSDNPQLIETGLKQACSSPHKKNGMDRNDVRTTYGLLYVSYDNLKQKHGQTTSTSKPMFIEHFMSNKIFNKMFKAYKKSNFNINFKPTFSIVDKTQADLLSPNNITVITHKEHMTNLFASRSVQVTEFRNGKPYKLHNSIGQASENAGVSKTTVKYHINRNKRGVKNTLFKETTKSDKEYIEDNTYKKTNGENDWMATFA